MRLWDGVNQVESGNCTSGQALLRAANGTMAMDGANPAAAVFLSSSKQVCVRARFWFCEQMHGLVSI